MATRTARDDDPEQIDGFLNTALTERGRMSGTAFVMRFR